ncbi:MAG TPA: SDR family NAD(P)-dependent oxidoreductase, partial [Stellaceae bacterium]|nr:SDR family NAD(P)-dependent oxidoreductase [Stellaceae bacterium]
MSARNVIVTGASRGLGLGIARTLRDAGYRVVAIARSPTEGTRDLHFVASDLADTAAIPGLISGIRKEFGPIWGLVNNAGIGTSGVLAT